MPRFDPARLPERVLHCDDDVLVLDKPAGVAVHAGPGRGEPLDAGFHHLRFGLEADPALAHRLDRETSGCLVLGRHRRALQRLHLLFREGQVEKLYWAVVLGDVAGDEGRIEAPLARRSHDKRSWWMRVDATGDASTTLWRVIGRGDGLTALALRPLTGRTHQIRVHCAHRGHPIAGDRVYGGDRALAASAQLHLHARAVAIPFTRARRIAATAAVPEHMAALLAACGVIDDLALAGRTAVHDL